MEREDGVLARRAVLGMGLAMVACAPAHASSGIVLRLKDLLGIDDRVTGGGRSSSPSPVRQRFEGSGQPRPALFRRALASLDSHAGSIRHRDRIAVVDFAVESSRRRLHVLDLVSGRSWSSLVSHGSGSDPARTGWVQRTSNEEGSNASCEGAFVTSAFYEGRHGRSQRLVGLDRTNDNALRRAIVVHGAWYAEPGVAASTGALGRSQGCFAVGDTVLPELLSRLGEGRMIYASRV